MPTLGLTQARPCALLLACVAILEVQGRPADAATSPGAVQYTNEASVEPSREFLDMVSVRMARAREQAKRLPGDSWCGMYQGQNESLVITHKEGVAWMSGMCMGVDAANVGSLESIDSQCALVRWQRDPRLDKLALLGQPTPAMSSRLCLVTMNGQRFAVPESRMPYFACLVNAGQIDLAEAVFLRRIEPRLRGDAEGQGQAPLGGVQVRVPEVWQPWILKEPIETAIERVEQPRRLGEYVDGKERWGTRVLVHSGTNHGVLQGLVFFRGNLWEQFVVVEVLEDRAWLLLQYPSSAPGLPKQVLNAGDVLTTCVTK